jgi:hypothetical protein
MSPFAMTGMRDLGLDRADGLVLGGAAVAASAGSAVNGDRRDAGLLLRSAPRAPLRWSGSQPVRVFSVTGTPSGADRRDVAASRMRATSASSRNSAEPAARLQTFFAGQPMLMSITCAPSATLARAAGGNHLGIAAGDLHDHRVALAGVVEPVAALGRAPQPLVRGDHLGGGEARAEPPAERAEWPVGDAGHRGERHDGCSKT